MNDNPPSGQEPVKVEFYGPEYDEAYEEMLEEDRVEAENK